VHPFITKVQDTISRHSMLTHRERVLVGVSGGADSTALVLALRELGYQVAVAHLNHGLRGSESDADEQAVKALATDLDVLCFTQSVSLPKDRGNIEAAGRAARQEFFRSVMQTHGFTKLALAHNREDRVETFLLHLMRGAGTEGLVSMAPVVEETVRPLIETSRPEIESYLKDLGRSWRTDATNLDMSFARNRMRHEVIPKLASLFNAQLQDTLSRTLTLMEDEDLWMKTEAISWFERAGGLSGLDVRTLNELPTALARRVIREGLRESLGDLTDLTFEHIEAIRGLLEGGKSGKSIHLPGGAIVAREFHRLVFSRSALEDVVFSYDLPIPGIIRIPEVGRSFRAQIVEAPEADLLPDSGQNRVFVDGSNLGAYVKIRTWKPGDYYRPAGWPAGKVKKLFQRARIPRSQRNRWPIIASESEIVWVTSFPVSREFVPSPCSKKIVAFEALER
jgi:tRNA(Ile)-lysidine synthase